MKQTTITVVINHPHTIEPWELDELLESFDSDLAEYPIEWEDWKVRTTMNKETRHEEHT
jgi:hypothetical protein